MPKQAFSRFVAGQPLPTHAAALRQAHEWIKINWDAQQGKRPKQATKAGDVVSVLYIVGLFKEDDSAGFDFEDFGEAKAFAKAAEKSASITKVGITNNESPQYLTVWEKS